MKACPGCERSIADILGQCPFCRHIFPTSAEKPTLDPELIQAALAAERATSGFGDISFVQPALLALALPVLVPSLIWFWIGAKRWGRVDWVLLAVVGAVLTLFATGSTPMLLVMLFADAAAAALFLMRYPRLDEGIFLGYSNHVAMCLILGGLLAGGSLVLFAPLGSLMQLANLFWLETALTPEALAAAEPPPAPRPVGLDPAGLDPDAAWAMVTGRKGPRFVRRPSTSVIEVTRPKELWDRRKELAGNLVLLKGAPAVHASFVRSGVDLEREKGHTEKDPDTRVHGFLDDTDGRVWIASPPLPAGDTLGVVEAETLKQPGDRTGRLLIAYTDVVLSRAWTPLGMWYQLPSQIVALLPEGAGAEDAFPRTAPAFVAVGQTKQRAWVHFPDGLPGALPLAVHGVLEVQFPGLHPFADHLQRHSGPDFRNVRLIQQVDRGTYARTSGLLGKIQEGFSAGWLIALGLGSLFILAGLAISARE